MGDLRSRLHRQREALQCGRAHTIRRFDKESKRPTDRRGPVGMRNECHARRQRRSDRRVAESGRRESSSGYRKRALYPFGKRRIVLACDNGRLIDGQSEGLRCVRRDTVAGCNRDLVDAARAGCGRTLDPDK